MPGLSFCSCASCHLDLPGAVGLHGHPDLVEAVEVRRVERSPRLPEGDVRAVAYSVSSPLDSGPPQSEPVYELAVGGVNDDEGCLQLVCHEFGVARILWEDGLDQYAKRLVERLLNV